jgi:hypothetical protein
MPIATVCLLKKIQIARPRIVTSDELVTKPDEEDRLRDINQLSFQASEFAASPSSKNMSRP